MLGYYQGKWHCNVQVLERVALHRGAPNPEHSAGFDELEQLLSLLLEEHQHSSAHAPAVDTAVLHEVMYDVTLQGS